jgi:hypothetical protein
MGLAREYLYIFDKLLGKEALPICACDAPSLRCCRPLSSVLPWAGVVVPVLAWVSLFPRRAVCGVGVAVGFALLSGAISGTAHSGRVCASCCRDPRAEAAQENVARSRRGSLPFFVFALPVSPAPLAAVYVGACFDAVVRCRDVLQSLLNVLLRSACVRFPWRCVVRL